METLSSMDDEVEILEPRSSSTSIFASKSSNPRHVEGETLGEGLSSGRKSLNPSQGMDLICNCDEKNLSCYLKSAVERKDFAFVFNTLRGRELRFRKSEEAMEEEVRTLKKELVAVREAEGKNFEAMGEEVMRLKRELVAVREAEGKNSEAMEEEVKVLKRELVAVREAEGKKFSNLMEEYEGLRVKHRETETQLEDLKKRFDFLAKFYREEISEGLNCGSMKKKSIELEDNSVKGFVFGCETPDRGQVDTGMDTPVMEICTPKSLEKSGGTGKEWCTVKRTLKFDDEDNAETQGRKEDGNADAFNLPAHGSDLPLSSAKDVATKVSTPQCSVNGIGQGVSHINGLGNNEIEEKYLNRQSEPMVIMKKNEDELITPANLGASCHSSKDKAPKDRLQCSIPAGKIDMQGSVAVGTALRNDVVILSDSESESSGPSLRKKRLSPCSKKATCSPQTQNIEVDIHSRVKIEGVSDDDGKYSDQNEEQTLQRGAKRRCHMTVTSDSESDRSDVGFSCKRRKPRSGNLQIQVICEAEFIKDTKCETSPKGPKEDAVFDAPCETYECRVLDRNMEKEDSLSCEEVPDMKLKRIRKTKDVKTLLTAGHCDEQTDEIQAEASPGARFRSLKKVIEGNELPNSGQLDKDVCPDQGASDAKYRRLKRGGGEVNGPEKSNVGNVLEKNMMDPSINDVNDGTIFNDNEECESSIGCSTFASKGKSDGATKVAEGPSDSPIYTQNNRRLRSQTRKMINLTKESDGEDEDENNSQTDDLGDFIVDSSDSEKDSKCADENKSDSENSTSNSDSEVETNPSSEDDLHEVIRKLSRQRETKLDWKYEGEMLAAFAKDDVLCMRAVCALNRQQTNDERRGKSSFYLNRRGFDKIHASRGSLLADFLTDNDPSGPMKKSLRELQKHDSKGAQYCKDLASRHSKQLFEIYKNNEDPHFPLR